MEQITVFICQCIICMYSSSAVNLDGPSIMARLIMHAYMHICQLARSIQLILAADSFRDAVEYEFEVAGWHIMHGRAQLYSSFL